MDAIAAAARRLAGHGDQLAALCDGDVSKFCVNAAAVMIRLAARTDQRATDGDVPRINTVAEAIHTLRLAACGGQRAGAGDVQFIIGENTIAVVRFVVGAGDGAVRRHVDDQIFIGIDGSAVVAVFTAGTRDIRAVQRQPGGGGFIHARCCRIISHRGGVAHGRARVLRAQHVVHVHTGHLHAADPDGVGGRGIRPRAHPRRQHQHQREAEQNAEKTLLRFHKRISFAFFAAVMTVPMP